MCCFFAKRNTEKTDIKRLVLGLTCNSNFIFVIVSFNGHPGTCHMWMLTNGSTAKSVCSYLDVIDRCVLISTMDTAVPSNLKVKKHAPACICQVYVLRNLHTSDTHCRTAVFRIRTTCDMTNIFWKQPIWRQTYVFVTKEILTLLKTPHHYLLCISIQIWKVRHRNRF